MLLNYKDRLIWRNDEIDEGVVVAIFIEFDEKQIILFFIVSLISEHI